MHFMRDLRWMKEWTFFGMGLAKRVKKSDMPKLFDMKFGFIIFCLLR